VSVAERRAVTVLFGVRIEPPGGLVLAAALFEEALATFAGDGLASVGGDGHQL
jgi:hypothetical protein